MLNDSHKNTTDPRRIERIELFMFNRILFNTKREKSKERIKICTIEESKIFVILYFKKVDKFLSVIFVCKLIEKNLLKVENLIFISYSFYA